MSTRLGGLTTAEARRRLEAKGPGRLPDATPDSLIKRIAQQFNDILLYVLLVAVVVTALLRDWIDSGVILGAVAANAAMATGPPSRPRSWPPGTWCGCARATGRPRTCG